MIANTAIAARKITTSCQPPPTAERHWDYTPSIEVMKQLVGDRMFPLTIEGLDKAMRELAR